jgi:HlyD family secretion protein
VQFESPASGLLISLNVQAGSRVRKGQVIGKVDQSELKQQLQQAQAKLVELQKQNRDTSALQQRGTTLERKSLKQQRASLQENLRNAEALTPTLREKGFDAIAQNRQSLEQQLQQVSQLLPTLKQRLDIRHQLAAEGAISQELILQAEQDYTGGLAQQSNLEVQLKQLEVQETEAQQQYEQNLSLISDLKNKIQDIDTQEAQLSQQDLEKFLGKTNQVEETKGQIAKLQLELTNASNIISQYNGRVLEVGIVPGKTTTAGGRLGAIEVEDARAALTSLTYFADKDGKQIKAGMRLEVTPSVIKRERFGGIVAKVTDVSPFPVTTQDVAAIIGNQDVAEGLAKNFSKEGGTPVQVFAQLETNSATFTGYQWSSSAGPDLKLSPGTTTTVRVSLEERAPISYVIPILRSWTGIY